MLSRSLLARVVLAACALAPLPAIASVSHTATFTAAKSVAPPPATVDLSAPTWQQALTATDFYDYTTRQPAAHATTAYFTYDDKNLYAAFHCAQAGVPITMAQAVDDAGVGTDDNVALWIDTSGNFSRVYSFSATPKGVHSESSSENSRYAPRWQSLAKIEPNGDYDVVMIIPLNDIRAQSTPVQQWHINFIRFIAATGDQYTWAYEPTENSPTNAQFWPALDKVEIAARAARPAPRADIYALGSGGSDHNQFQNTVGNFQTQPARPLGVDVTYPFTNTLSFVGTLNPDFSNVEQDQTIIAPQEFQRNFVEYRPFFSQGAQFINVLPNANINSNDTFFYSPSIGVFDRGLKFEGTTGKSSVGLINVLGGGVNDNVAAYDFNSANNALNLSYEGVYANHDGVRDDSTGLGLAISNPHSGVVFGGRNEFESGTLVGSNTALAQDNVYLAGLQSARWQAFVVYKDIGPDFNPVDSFTTLNDVRGPQGFVQYSGGATGPLKSYQVLFGGDRFLDRSGAVHDTDTFSSLSATFNNLIAVSLGSTTSLLRQYSQGYPFYTNGLTQPFDSTSLAIGYRDSTPSPIDASYSWGPFGGIFLQQFTSSTTRHFGPLYGVSLEYDGNLERLMDGSGPATTQWLRRVSLTRSFGKNGSLAIGLRSINGLGGFAVPGSNVAISYHQRFTSGDELWFDYGTPAANQTLHRLILKYVFHAGGGNGT